MAEDTKSLLELLLHYSSSSSGILVAHAVGIFTILTLFTQVGTWSIAWFVLSIAYGFTCLAGALIFRNWAASEIMMTHYFGAIDEETKSELIGNRKIRKLFFGDVFVNKEGFFLCALVIIFLLAGLTWFVFAFKMFEPLW